MLALEKVTRNSSRYGPGQRGLGQKPCCNIHTGPMWKELQAASRSFALEKEMATHCSLLAWRIPRKEEPRAGGITFHGVIKKRTRLTD